MAVTRAAAKPLGARHYAEDFAPGDRIAWDAPPLVRAGAAMVPGPSMVAVVSWASATTTCVRFVVDGRLGEPTEVVTQQPCREEKSS